MLLFYRPPAFFRHPGSNPEETSTFSECSDEFVRVRTSVKYLSKLLLSIRHRAEKAVDGLVLLKYLPPPVRASLPALLMDICVYVYKHRLTYCRCISTVRAVKSIYGSPFSFLPFDR